jgi:hypothetical protein
MGLYVDAPPQKKHATAPAPWFQWFVPLSVPIPSQKILWTDNLQQKATQLTKKIFPPPETPQMDHGLKDGCPLPLAPLYRSGLGPINRNSALFLVL